MKAPTRGMTEISQDFRDGERVTTRCGLCDECVSDVHPELGHAWFVKHLARAHGREAVAPRRPKGSSRGYVDRREFMSDEERRERESLRHWNRTGRTAA